MLVSNVCFTGLNLSPEDVTDRWHRGIIPPTWRRLRFSVPSFMKYPVTTLNRWLFEHITGRWAIYRCYRHSDLIVEIVLAFEHDYDAMTFVLTDGQHRAFEDTSGLPGSLQASPIGTLRSP